MLAADVFIGPLPKENVDAVAPQVLYAGCPLLLLRRAKGCNQ